MSRTLAYCRVSGDSQAEEGRDGLLRQRLACEAVAKAHGWTISQFFYDKGISGTLEIENRPGLSDLRAVLKKGDVVIVEGADRIARKMLTFLVIMGDLEKLGVRVIAANGGELTVADDPAATLMRDMMAAFAAYERCIIVNKLAEARRRKREAGQRCDGRKPYGHNPEEKAGLALLLSMRGKRLKAIAEALEAAGHKPRSGGAWGLTTIAQVLRRTGGRKDAA